MNRGTLGKITHVDFLSATVWMFDKVELSVSPRHGAGLCSGGFIRFLCWFLSSGETQQAL